MIPTLFAGVVGSVSFWGSNIAFAKLQDLIPTRPLAVPGQQVINAVSLGSLYALVAIGLSMVFGILRMTNFAHGDMMMVGAFGTLVLGWLGLPFWLAFLGGIAIGALAGVIV